MTDMAERLRPPLISEHDTWISVDPMIGCPAHCRYCYLGKLGLTRSRPLQRREPWLVARDLHAYLHGRRAGLMDPATDQTPVCVGNYTDMQMTPATRAATVAVLEEMAARFVPRPVVLITKARLSASVVERLDGIGWPITWFFSQSFATGRLASLENGPVTDFEGTLANARLVASSRHQRAVHFWRPFVTELSPRSAKGDIIRRLKEAGMSGSVVIGFQRGPGVPLDDERLRTLLPSAFEASGTGEAFDHDGWQEVRTAARDHRYPVYRHSSCAIARVTGRPEGLGTWRPESASERCHPCQCPRSQRALCDSRKKPGRASASEGERFSRRVAVFLGLPEHLVIYDEATRSVRIEAEVGEYDFNTVLHAANGDFLPIARAFVGQKAWHGPFIARPMHRQDQE